MVYIYIYLHRMVMKNLLYLYFITCSHLLWAQTAFPPITKTGGHNTCSANNWQLVFVDEFNDVIDKRYWNTFGSWYNMEPNDHEDWDGARARFMRIDDSIRVREILLDKNVFIEDGWAKLKVFKEPVSWNCASCDGPIKQAQFSAAALDLNFRNNYLNHGKIEVRATMPTFDYGHHAIWLWYGVNCINEIDLIEAYGSRNTYAARNKYATYNVHEWNNATKECDGSLVRIVDKKTGEPQHVDASLNRIGGHQKTFMRSLYRNNRFQRTANWYNRTYRPEQIFDMEAPHIYSVAFDTHNVFFYLDNMLLAQIPKYYAQMNGRRVIPECFDNRLLTFNNGFPWDTDARMQFRMGVGMHNSLFKDPATIHQLKDGFLGEMTVDYVKIYQQYESDNWKFLTHTTNNVEIIGPQFIGNDEVLTYYVHGKSNEGKWSISPHFIMLEQQKDTIKIKPIVDVFTDGIITFQPHNADEKSVLNVYKNISNDLPSQLQLVNFLIDTIQHSYLFYPFDYPVLANEEKNRIKYAFYVSYRGADNIEEVLEFDHNYLRLPQHWDLDNGKMLVHMTQYLPFENQYNNKSFYLNIDNNLPNASTIQLNTFYVDNEMFHELEKAVKEELLFFPYEVKQDKYVQEVEHEAILTEIMWLANYNSL